MFKINEFIANKILKIANDKHINVIESFGENGNNFILENSEIINIKGGNYKYLVLESINDDFYKLHCINDEHHLMRVEGAIN